MLASGSYDVVIIGGGVVGLTAACGLADAGLKVIVVNKGELTSQCPNEPQLRVSAINLASEKLLKNIGAWSFITSERCCNYSQMQVWDKNGAGKIDFKASGLKSLGTIIENDHLSYALATRLSEFSNLTLVENTKVENIIFGEREAWLTLDSKQQFSAQLVIAADGANSDTRKKSHIPLSFWDYKHHGIVATISCEYPHENTARQIFTDDGVLAFLPLFKSHLCSIVWSVAPQKAQELINCDEVAFEKALTAAFEGRMGICRLAGNGQRQSFPLTMRYARQFAQHRLVLIGDAAHTIHPLAGQGMNLGLADAASIIETVTHLYHLNKDIGEYKNLRDFERYRKAEAIKMISLMEGLKGIFSGNDPVKKTLRDLGLNVINNLPFVKDEMIKQAMGISNNLPSLCR